MESIQADRRADRRYTIETELRYKLLNGNGIIDVGLGKTCDMSCKGVSFKADRPLRSGTFVELFITWPLPGDYPVELLILGRVIRSASEGTVVRIGWYEFCRLENGPAAENLFERRDRACFV